MTLYLSLMPARVQIWKHQNMIPVEHGFQKEGSFRAPAYVRRTKMKHIVAKAGLERIAGEVGRCTATLVVDPGSYARALQVAIHVRND